MSSTTKGPEDNVDLIQLIASEIKESREQYRPTSRQRLAELVQERTGMPHAEATALVDTYCEENEPGVPYYLQEEFAIPYLKVIAVLNVLCGIAACYYGVKVLKTSKPGWPWFCLGTTFCGLGALAWVKSLERYAARKRQR